MTKDSEMAETPEKLSEFIFNFDDAIDNSRLFEFVHNLPKPVVSAGGVFDILHSGHLALLHEARLHGNSLIVLTNTDKSVKKLGKGPNRPVICQNERALLLAALKCVDGVILFDEATPNAALRSLMPDIYCKGGDYSTDELMKTDLKDIDGIQPLTTSYIAGRSSSNIINNVHMHQT